MSKPDGAATEEAVRPGRPEPPEAPEHPEPPSRGTAREVFTVALRLGCTSFGGPIAHLGYFQNEYVRRRRWVSEDTYADLVALSQSLPGAASSKLGIAVGMIRAGMRGGIAAWIGFTLPSAVLMTLFAFGASSIGSSANGWLRGLQIVAVAVVALAVWNMATKLITALSLSALAVVAAVVELTLPSRVTTVAIIIVAGVVGYFLGPDKAAAGPAHLPIGFGKRAAIVAAVLFFGLLVALPVLRHATGSHAVALFDSTYRAGALVFGGGTVVLPLLQGEVVAPGWLGQSQFLAGYGAAQAMPGPLFTFSAFIGAAENPAPNGVLGAAIALVGIFLPSFLIVVATLPSLGAIRNRPNVRACLRGVNAAVVGILLAALYDPLWTGTMHHTYDFALVLVAFWLLAMAKLPAWLVVALTAAGGALITALGG
ncbi:MAG TPA: chromate efflux transporter [Streptosporangiaceae bacterium]|nr:chromate efflux transporter [Streptosporangiaceae bacterium]